MDEIAIKRSKFIEYSSEYEYKRKCEKNPELRIYSYFMERYFHVFKVVYFLSRCSFRSIMEPRGKVCSKKEWWDRYEERKLNIEASEDSSEHEGANLRYSVPEFWFSEYFCIFFDFSIAFQGIIEESFFRPWSEGTPETPAEESDSVEPDISVREEPEEHTEYFHDRCEDEHVLSAPFICEGTRRDLEEEWGRWPEGKKEWDREGWESLHRKKYSIYRIGKYEIKEWNTQYIVSREGSEGFVTHSNIKNINRLSPLMSQSKNEKESPVIPYQSFHEIREFLAHSYEKQDSWQFWE